MTNASRYHNDAARTGWFQGAKRGVPNVSSWRKYLNINLGSTVRGAPLVLENWTLRGGPLMGQTHNLLFVTNSINLVNAYRIEALQSGNANPLWSTQLPPASNRSGSNIPPPVGISSTPVIDEASGQMHVLALQVNKFTSRETSPKAPALCVHNNILFIAWKGDGNDHLNVAQVQFSSGRVSGFTNKVILGDTSPVSPALASFNGRLYISWKGDGNDQLNVMVSEDNGHSFGHKFVSQETSPQPPALCVHNGVLFIAWKGDGNDQLNVAQVQTSGANIAGFANKTVLGDTSPVSPTLASFGGRLYIGWKGDGNDQLNVMVSEDNGHSFGHKFVSHETSPHPPALCAHNGILFIGWKGDGNDQLNIAIVGVAGSTITGFFGKQILDDSSPVNLALTSFGAQLCIGWKGDGNDFLNVIVGLPGYYINVLDVNTGALVNSHMLLDFGATGRPTFVGIAQDQRGGLNLSQSWVYATFADFLAFDKGDYHGWVVGWQASNPAQQTFVPLTRTITGGGAWGPGGPAATDASLYVTTGNGGTDAQYWSNINGGTLLGNKFTSAETSPKSPALCAHSGMLFIAWKGDGNDQLNVAQVEFAGTRITGLKNKVVLGDTSPLSPTLASLNGRLFIGWKGDGNDQLNVMVSDDNGRTFGHKFVSGETSPQPPVLCAHNGALFIGWKGDGNDQLNVAQVQIAGANITGFTNKVILHDTSPVSPTLASLNGRLFIGWKGDGNNNLNIMNSSNNGRTFGQKFVLSETSPQAPVLAVHNGGLYLGWKGDGNDQLNVAQVLLFEGAVVDLDKAILADTSPVGPALASINNMLCVGWKGGGNDNLNVMRLASPGEIGDFHESIVRLATDGRVAFVDDWYTPLSAQSLDAQDLDIGGSSVLALPPIGGLELLVVTGKDGHVYLLNRLALGRLGGALWREHLYDSESKCAPSYFHTPQGDDQVFVIGGGGPGLVAFKVVVHGTEAGLQQLWKATGRGISLGDFPGSPTTQSFPDQASVVWIVDDTIPALRAFDVTSGAEVYNSSRQGGDALGDIAHFPPIACAAESVFVGTANGFACYGLPLGFHSA